ncbi:MAG: response regulator transcription factor [Anaerolineales bacterium]|nr:response regulator transcription factor [Anaerolineales bacterium]MCB8967213.1 response regulator transcription factor [Ardenticatenaceae bacterium]
MSQPAGSSPDKLRILIADDVTETRRSTRLMLSMIPAAEVVAIAKNGREAVEMTRQHRPDIALMDVNMPEMDGISAIQAMTNEWPQMACIVISAERDPQTLLDAMAAGARGYLTKPFTADQLIETFRRVVKQMRIVRQPSGDAAALRQQRDKFLKELANEYIRTRRTDDKAMEVLEVLAQDPNCETRLLTALAMIYALNSHWGKLKKLAERLEKQSG